MYNALAGAFCLGCAALVRLFPIPGNAQIVLVIVLGIIAGMLIHRAVKNGEAS